MTLLLPDGSQFAGGCGHYSCRPVSALEQNTRLFVRIRVEDLEYNIDAVLDTGGLYFIPHPGLINDLRIADSEILSRTTVIVRGLNFSGLLCRLNVTLLATESGDETTIDTTAFVPDLAPEQVWPLPVSYLGWHACLERIRFAIDPVEELFYFGSA